MWFKKNWPIFGVWFAVIAGFGGLFLLAPKEAAIYFEDSVDRVGCTLTADNLLCFDIRDDASQNGQAVFEPADGQKIVLVNMDEQKNAAPIALEGDCVTIKALSSLLRLTAEPQENADMFCRLTLTKEGTGDGEKSRIDIEFLTDAHITIHNWNNEEFDAVLQNMPENLDDTPDFMFEQIPDGEYQVEGYGAVSFYMSQPPAGNRSEDETRYAFGLDAAISEFEIWNNNRAAIEVTVAGKTDFHEIGHIDICGQAVNSKELRLKIDDLGGYTSKTIVQGTASELTFGGTSYFPGGREWLYENRTDILRAALTTLVTTIISMGISKIGKGKAVSSKPEATSEK